MPSPFRSRFIAPCLLLCTVAQFWAGPQLRAQEESAADAAAEPAAPTRHSRVYYFQHRLLPQWTFGSDGAFFTDLRDGHWERLREAAADIVDADFADALTVTALRDGAAMLIAFDAPQEAPENHFCFIAPTGEPGEFVFYTLEKTVEMFADSPPVVFGEWTAEGSHRNHGGRSSADKDAFVKTAFAQLTLADQQPSAESTPASKQD